MIIIYFVCRVRTCVNQVKVFACRGGQTGGSISSAHHRLSLRSSLFALFALLALAVLSATSGSAEGVDVSFIGPSSAHISYAYTAFGALTQVKVQVVSGSATRVIVQAEGPDARVEGTYQDTGLAAGYYDYQICQRTFHEETYDEEAHWGTWGVRYSLGATIDPAQAISGTLLFDEELADVTIGWVNVPPGITLTLAGTLSTVYASAAIEVQGALTTSGPVTLLPHVGDSFDTPFYVYLGSPNALTGITGGEFFSQTPGSSFTACTGNLFSLRAGGTLTSISNGVVELSYLQDGATVEATDSTLSSAGAAFRSGKLALERVTWSGNLEVFGKAGVDATDTTFLGTVTVTDDNAEPGDTSFHAAESRFFALQTKRAGAGRVSLERCLFAGTVTALGGAASFDGCEFGEPVDLQDRSATSFAGCRFLEAVVFVNTRDADRVWLDVPRWNEAAEPSPLIAGNAFMGPAAFNYESTAYPPAPIAIGANYYGTRHGLFRGYFGDGNYPGFLQIDSGSAKGYRAVYWDGGDTSTFTFAPHLESSPLSAPRQDKRVFPRFWPIGHMAGQNTIPHDSGTLDTSASRIQLKGRETLLALEIACSEESLAGVRIYAEWNGQRISCQRNDLIRRDPAHFTPTQIRFGRSTYSIILPGVQASEMPVDVYLDASGVSGYDAASYPYPLEDRLLLSGTLHFVDPPQRPLRIWVIPVEVTGLMGTWGTADATATTRELTGNFPDLFPLPANRLQVVQRPKLTVWSPTSFITSFGMLNKVAANLALGRWLGSGQADAPDFIVAVMPKGIFGPRVDGASFRGRRRVVFVDEGKPKAVHHELGHGIGLYTGWEEQYDLHPPSGLPVRHFALFATESQGLRDRARHLPGPDQSWYDKESEHFDIMGSVEPSAPLPESLAAFHAWFQTNLTLPAPAASAAPCALAAPLDLPAEGERRILVSGVIDAQSDLLPGSLALLNVTALGLNAVYPGIGDLYRFIAFDGDGVPVLEQGFKPEAEASDWIATFDLPAGATSFSIVRTNGWSVIMNANATGLLGTTLHAPAPGGVIGPLFEASWGAQTLEIPAPDQMLHTLYYRLSGTNEWQLLVGPTTATNITTASSVLPECEGLALKLVSSDGLDSAEHVVEGLSVPPRAPLVTITKPEPGTQAQSNAVWSLVAQVIDFPTDSAAPGSWSSSLQGELGEGRELETELIPGEHLLRYETATPGGLTGQAEVAVRVEPVLTALDLGLAASDLNLLNRTIDPNGLVAPLVFTNVDNRFSLRLRNGGADATARLRLFLRQPDGVETLGATYAVALAPFAASHYALDFIAEQEGAYTLRAVVDEVDPPDPDLTNNERQWSFATRLSQVTLNANPYDGGTVSGEGDYLAGATVTVIATASSNHVFVRWSEDGVEVSTQEQFTVTLTGDRTLDAHFAEAPGTLDPALADALDTAELAFTTGGPQPWTRVVTEAAYQDGDAARSGAIADGEWTWMETTVTGPGTLGFCWRASTEDVYDRLVFLVDGEEQATLSGETDWENVTHSLGYGQHTLRWEYFKDGSLAGGDDAVWVDGLTLEIDEVFATQWTPVPVPFAWFDNYPALLAAHDFDYEFAAWSDIDNDRHVVWQEYVAGTNPEDSNSVLRAWLTMEAGTPRVTWSPDLGDQRIYTVEGRASLTDFEWWGPVNSTSRYFRVTVEMP